MRIQDKRIVIGIDTDTASEGVSSSLARRVDNCRVNIVNGGNDGIVEPVKGNTEILYDLPSGDNKTIGILSDTTKNRIFYFNYNSNNIDGIYEYTDAGFTKIVEGNLGWTSDLDIHSITIINNLLTWVEGNGKYPRQVDVNKQYINPSEFDLSYIKTPPTFPLQIQGQDKVSISQNFYNKNYYYFIYRFVYENGQQSTWSPYSKMASTFYGTFDHKDFSSVNFKINELRVFREGGLDGLQYNTRIRYIDFAYANTYLGPFKFFKRTKVENVLTEAGWDLLILSDTDLSTYGTNKDISVQFRNDLSFSVLDQDTDTIRPYDEIWPAEAITSADNRNIIANTLEGFPGFDLQIGNVSQGFKKIDYFTRDSSQYIPSIAETKGNFMTWKNYSKYGIGIVFYNEFGQKSGVYTDQRLKVLTPADYRQPMNDSVWAFNFMIGGQPPIWATHYQIVRTNNNKTIRFVQGITNDILFVSSYNEDGTPNVIPKIIGIATSEIKLQEILHIIGIGGVNGERRIGNVTSADPSGSDYNYPNIIYEFGTDSTGDQVNRRISWYDSFGNQAGFTFFSSKYYPVGINNWPGRPDSQPYDAEYENQFQIGTLDPPISGNPIDNLIYIGGVNRRGEKINRFNTSNLQEAIDILIDIYNWNNTTKFEENKFNSVQTVARHVYNPSNETPYIFQKGDRVNIYYSSTGEYIGINDLEIKDFINGRYIKVKYDKRFLDAYIVGSGALMEIYTPNTGSDDILFYEYGDCYPIMNPKTDQRAYSKIDFSIFEGDTHYMTYAELYATDIRVNFRNLEDIDYKTGRGYAVYPFFSMNPDPLNRADIWEKANGRSNAVLLDGERQTLKKSTIRYSDRYIDGASVNGTSTYYSFNSLQLDYDWGAIRKLTSQEQILLVNCEQEAALVYVNNVMLSNTDGSDNLVISEKTLNSPRKLPGAYGCVNPESVSQYNEYIYFWSKPKGAALRYNTFNGLFDISGAYKARSYFLNKISNKCQAGFDPIYRTQYFCFDDETIGFIDPKGQDYPNTWAGFFSYLPEKLAFIQLQLYTFKNGKLYKHETGTTNTFYGVKYPSKIEMVFNTQPNVQKIFNFISQESDKPLLCPIITNQEGQTTDIQEFEKINKDWQADIPGDTSYGASKWEGDLMSSHILNVTFQWDLPEAFRLRYLNLYSQINERTNK